MLELRDRGDLPAKTLGAECGGELGEQHLECDGPLVLGVAREVYRRHAAASELALDRVRRAKRNLQLIQIRCSQLEALPRRRVSDEFRGVSEWPPAWCASGK